MDSPKADFDSVWKQAFARYFVDFTALFLLEDWTERPAPESLDQELVKCTRDGKHGLVRVDKLLRVVGADGDPCLWHVEIQVARQASFAERMFVCQYRLFDHFRLPVRSVAILGDPSPTWRPDSFEIAAGRSRTRFEFEMFKLRDYDKRIPELLRSDNIFGWLVAAHLFTLRTRRELGARMMIKDSLLTELASRGWEHQKMLDAYDLIDRMMRLPAELQAVLDERQGMSKGAGIMAWKMAIEERAEARWRERSLQEGRQEGRLEGRLEALRELLMSQMVARFGALDEGTRQRIAAATSEELEHWGLAVLGASRPAEVFRSAT